MCLEQLIMNDLIIFEAPSCITKRLLAVYINY